MRESTTPPGRLPPRVRIAPSPTGDPHVGTAYIALFNFVFARKYGGRFVLRIEDTDQERSTASSEAAILEALRWLGFEWEEGPDVGGPHGPYRQSERLGIYQAHVQRLLDGGHAYRCFCTRERLDALRREQIEAKASHLGYDGHCRALSPDEGARRAADGEAHVVRLRVPSEGETSFFDHLRQETIGFQNEQIDDQVLVKSDGFPTYHLANVVDDHLMGITHVIRGEEWITSTPKHVLLYRAFGWEEPCFFHLGLLRNTDRSKLSKRKNPVSIFHYRDLGYLPETLLNFMATLGFSMGDDRERFTLDEMITAFEWSKVSAGGPVFDAAKLDAFNGADIRAMDVDTLHRRLLETTLAPERLRALLFHAKERIARLDDVVPYISFAFGAEVDYGPVLDKVKIKKRSRQDVIDVLERFAEEIERDPAARTFEAAALEAFSRGFCERSGWKAKDLFTLLRIAVTGRTAAPPLFDTMAICGKDRCRLRIRDLIGVLGGVADW
ncbi:MAG: glutamate--tRNA ligase [Myxococcales bacterium]|nr:glutamate--tRNA ligase [Myxococcales bacterium]